MTQQLQTEIYRAALAMLARREISTAQLSERLARKGFPADDITPVLHRLQQERALDDARTAGACARREAHIKLHGRRRALMATLALGIAPELSEQAVAEVYAELDERDILERRLDRRLTGPVRSRAEFRRLYRAMVRLGFDGSTVVAALKARLAPSAHGDPEQTPDVS